MNFQPRSRYSLLIFCLYFALALVITFPLVLHFSTQMIGHSTGDAYEMGHHIWWFKYALQHGEPIFWQPLSGYPDGFSAVSLWANPLQFFPAWLFAFVLPVAAAYNLAVLLAMALNGWAMCFVMSRWLAGDEAASGNLSADDARQGDPPPGEAPPRSYNLPGIVAGAIYLSFSTMQGHLFGGHAGLLVAWGAPLYLYALFNLIETPSRRWFGLAVLFFLLTPSGHTLQLFYVLMPLTGLVILARLARGDWHGVGLALAVSIAGSLLLLIFVLPVFQETFADDTYTGDRGYVPFSIDLLGVVTPSFGHPLFGRLDYTGQVLGTNFPEGYSYLGLAAGVLALIGIFGRKTARWWLLVAFVAWLLALGPIVKLLNQPLVLNIDGYPATLSAPWAFLYNLPGFSLARTPGRFTFTLALAVAVLAGYGAQVIWRYFGRGIRAHALLIGLTVFAVWEYQAFFPHYTVPADVPAPITDLRTDDTVRAVLDLPWGNLLAAKQGLYLQTAHEKPLVAGQVTRRTPVSPAKLTVLEQTLDLALLDNAGVDVVILHKAYADFTLDERLRAQFGAPSFEDDRFALFHVPETDEGLRVTPVMAPSQAVRDRADSYLFTASPGWMDFSGSLRADGRTVVLYLNGRRVHQWVPVGRTPFIVPLPVDYRGYHTVTLAVEPPCPLFYDDTLDCRTLTIADLTLTPLSAGPVYEPIPLGRGVTLAGAHLPTDPITDGVLSLRLWWTFAEPLNVNDIRFIKVLDAAGQQVAALDTSPGGAHSAGSEWIERLDLDLGGLQGDFRVVVGWYSLPDVVRFPVLAEVPGAADGLIDLGVITAAP